MDLQAGPVVSLIEERHLSTHPFQDVVLMRTMAKCGSLLASPVCSFHAEANVEVQVRVGGTRRRFSYQSTVTDGGLDVSRLVPARWIYIYVIVPWTKWRASSRRACDKKEPSIPKGSRCSQPPLCPAVVPVPSDSKTAGRKCIDIGNPQVLVPQTST